MPGAGSRSLLLLLISHPFCCRERLGGLFSVWLFRALYLEELISAGTPTPQQRACTGEMLWKQSWPWMRFGVLAELTSRMAMAVEWWDPSSE